MDTVSYSFSACSDGGVSYTINCRGPDCSSLGDLFGSICVGDGNTVTCNYSSCTGSVDYTSTSQLYASNSTFYATNRLSINDCADVSFTVNGTKVLPLDTSNSQCSTASSISATAGSSARASSSLSASSGVLATLSTGCTTLSPSFSSTALTRLSQSPGLTTTPGSPIVTNPAATAMNPSRSNSEHTTSPLSRVFSSVAAGSSTVASPVPPSQTSLTPLSWSTKPAVSSSNMRGASSVVTSPSSGLQAAGSSPNSVPSSIGLGSSSMTQNLSIQKATSTAEVISATQQPGVSYETTATAVLTPVSKSTVPPIKTSSSTSLATVTVQKSGAASKRGSSTFHITYATILPLFLLVLALWTPTVVAFGGYTVHASNGPHLLLERGKDVLPASLERTASISTRGFLGSAISDVSTWYTQFTSFLSSSQPDLSSAFTTLETDILDYACEVFLSYVETDINRQLLFKQEWQQCVAQGETWVQELQQAVYANGTGTPDKGLAGHYLTVGLNLAASAGVKAGCDFLFSKLLQLELGVDPAEQTCDAWLASLGLTPPSAGAAPSATTSAPGTHNTGPPAPPPSFAVVIEGTSTSADGQDLETGGSDLNAVGFDILQAEAVFSIDSDTGYLYLTKSPSVIATAYIVTLGSCTSSAIKNIAPIYLRDSEATPIEQILAGGFAPLVCSVDSGHLGCSVTSPCADFPGTWGTWLLDSFGLYIATGPGPGYPQPELAIQT